MRPVVFLAYSGEARWRTSAGEEFAARLGEPLNAEQTARAWKTALDPQGDWIPAVLRAAHTRLHQLRKTIPDAGGLVIATDKTTARAYAKTLAKLATTPVSVVLSDEAGASERIEKFAGSTDEWMVAVRMVSEGVDVPRLAVGVYATSASTPLFFAQAIGRFVRSRRPGETASVFLPSVPVLLDLAAKLEVSRDHVLGKPHRETGGWDDELLAEANKRETEADQLKTYESLGAEAELDTLIYDGSSYGTATVAGSSEEADYLGLPGLLDAEQMRQLLRKRQEEQLNVREREAKEAAKREQEARRAVKMRRSGWPARKSPSCVRSSMPWWRSPRPGPAGRTGRSILRRARSAVARRPQCVPRSSCGSALITCDAGSVRGLAGAVAGDRGTATVNR